jgi:hypothetical protein
MIALVLSPTWANHFHASSPQMNLIKARHHASFAKFILLPGELKDPEVQAAINTCEALVVCYTNSYSIDFYKSGPRFLLWGDDHSHSPEEVKETESLHNRYDYVLCGSPHAPHKSPPYHYVSDESWAKRLYLPHSVPDERPPSPMWESRQPRAVLPSNVCPVVYPFRWGCGELKSPLIDDLPHFQKVHAAYFSHLGTYQYAITCNSHGWLNYTVAKYFEMPYMGCVTIATPLLDEESRRLGFEHGKNIIFSVDPREVPAIISGGGDYDRLAISSAGMGLMLTRHTATRRLDYIERLVARAMKGHVTAADSYDIFAEGK